MQITWPPQKISTLTGLHVPNLLQEAYETVSASGCRTPEEYFLYRKSWPSTHHFTGRTMASADPEMVRRAFVLKSAFDAGDEARVQFLVNERDGRNF